jgi:hypothetical protein
MEERHTQMLLRAAWQPGPAEGTEGPVFISVTDLRLGRLWDMPRVHVTGTRLRRRWQEIDGAVGLWLWAMPTQLRSGSVSVWESEEYLRQFVRWPTHVAIMARYRGRVTVQSASWQADRFVPKSIWAEARRHLASMSHPRKKDLARVAGE